jgi:large subunit ribosomal protein L29
MATKKYLELHDFSDSDLLNEFNEANEEYIKFKFDHSVAGLENPLSLRSLRRDISRIKTEMRRREIAAMDESELAKRARLILRRKINK